MLNASRKFLSKKLNKTNNNKIKEGKTKKDKRNNQNDYTRTTVCGIIVI